MSQPITQTQKAIDLFNSGDVKAALSIAKTFRAGLTKDEKETLSRGYECMVRPSFYQSLGKDVEACIAQAKAVFQLRIARVAV